MKKSTEPGATLLEVLVALALFGLLIGSMVGLSTSILDMWSEGEDRKDLSDRAALILGLLEDDLQNLLVERQRLRNWTEDEMVPAVGAHFVSDLDGAGRQILKLVRVSSRDEVLVPAPPPIRRAHPVDLFAPLYEVVWKMDDDPSKTFLWRGVRFFDRDPAKSVFTGKKIDPSIFRIVDSRVLYWELRFWGQETNRWDEREPGPQGRPPKEASVLWDSSRTGVKKFMYYRRRSNDPRVDFVAPEMARVTLVLRPAAFPSRRIVLTEPLPKESLVAHVNAAEELPDPPCLVRIGGEWVEVASREFSQLKLARRGQRLTQRKDHPAGALVEFGETFVRILPVGPRMEAVRR